MNLKCLHCDNDLSHKSAGVADEESPSDLLICSGCPAKYLVSGKQQMITGGKLFYELQEIECKIPPNFSVSISPKCNGTVEFRKAGDLVYRAEGTNFRRATHCDYTDEFPVNEHEMAYIFYFLRFATGCTNFQQHYTLK